MDSDSRLSSFMRKEVMLQSGDIISGMYQVIREIGTGGMGVIYIGYHLHLQKSDRNKRK